MAVDDVGVGGAGRVGNVGWIHAHRAPVQAVLQPLIAAGEQASEALALKVEMAGIDLHAAKDRFWRKRAVIGKHDHMLPIILDRTRVGGVDHDGAIMTDLFLKPLMAVLPNSPRQLRRAARRANIGSYG